MLLRLLFAGRPSISRELTILYMGSHIAASHMVFIIHSIRVSAEVVTNFICFDLSESISSSAPSTSKHPSTASY